MSKLLNCLNNKDMSCVPVWFMRQAGRYLPEFRQIRLNNPDFLKLCFNSDLATEITLQPMKRFNLDAAIIFSDILVVPYALRQPIDFKKTKKGPMCTNFNIDKLLDTDINKFISTLNPIYKAIKKTKRALNKKKSLIGFIGAPWTLIVYLYNLKEKKNSNNKISIKDKNNLRLILNKLDEFLKIHILKQKESGVEVIQIFDSWAGLIEKEDLDEFCYEPNKSLVNFCKLNNIPSICFPKGLKQNYINFINKVKPNAISIDYEIDPLWARENIKNVCIQGGMNPALLLQSEKEAIDEVEKYLEAFKNIPYIFNLGHGILPQTNPDIVKKIVDKIKLIRK